MAECDGAHASTKAWAHNGHAHAGAERMLCWHSNHAAGRDFIPLWPSDATGKYMCNSALDQQGKLFQLGHAALYLFIYNPSWFMLYLFTVVLPVITLEIILV